MGAALSFVLQVCCPRLVPVDATATGRERMGGVGGRSAIPHVDLSQLPEEARLWIFSAERPLAAGEQSRLLAAVDDFIGQWKARDILLTAGRELRHGRFLFVAVDQRQAGPSGCSIDTLIRRMKVLKQEPGVELVKSRAGSAPAR